ncbi:hypothetical protein [Pedobacter steynii]|nr:hypothetical protein [Pedobacter steynii]
MMKTYRTKVIFLGLIAGTLDGLAAIFLSARGNATMVFKYISSAVLGPEAFKGGAATVILGVGFHYFNAMAFTLFYFFIYPRVSLLRKNIVLSSLLYGSFIWIVMNLCVVPLSRINTSHFTISGVLKSWVILVVFIALPLAIGIREIYRNKTTSKKLGL